MNKTALITGASRGIGAAITRTFAKQGYALALCCRNSIQELETLATELRTSCKVPILVFQGDVGEESFVSDMLEETQKEFGHLDILINNAGISHIGLLTDMSLEDWNHIVTTNLTSAFLTCKYASPSMIARKQGKILNISSVWGLCGASCEVAYSTCKGGLNTFTKALGKELAPSNIQVNAIACGVIDTQMNACFSPEEKAELAEEIPAGRFGSPEEVAHLALQLVTENSYLTGQIITLDGGWI